MNEIEIRGLMTHHSTLILNKESNLNETWNSQSSQLSHTGNRHNNQFLDPEINLKRTLVNLAILPL
ncbi:hypothetical protein IAD21_02250 [Abditibacteriota bacterium]|nr:hypothetical protein IAD21_02250 [Abditibacteriota bacterium]